MLQTVATCLAALLVYNVGRTIFSLYRNIRKAKASGIHYIVVPVFFLSTWWLVVHRFLFVFLQKLPVSWTTWVDFTLPEFAFDYRIEVFKRVGHDTFLTVGPGEGRKGLTLYTAEPAVISQITTRRNDFPKPTHIYRSLDIYGKNVVTTEGHIWRQHRKATSPPFTEKNNHLVWKESIRQAQAMLKSWVGKDGKGHRTVDRVMDDTMRLSLYVITCAGFGRQLEWPAEDVAVKTDDSGYNDLSKIKNQQDDIDTGHNMSYTYSLHCLLDNILFQFILPRWMLKWGTTTMRKADESYGEWGNYMREALASKRTSLESGHASTEQMDILEQLIKGQLIEGGAKTSGTGVPPLTEEEVLGNMFVLILAGHETAANSIHFAILYLALHPESQRNLHKDLDRILQNRVPAEWDYDRDLPALFGGMPGAILAEELRLVPPVVGIPKSTYGVSDQKLTVDGRECTVPANTYISLATAAVQRHPNYWPAGPSRLPGGRPAHPCSNVDNDLEEFRPERWLEAASQATPTATELQNHGLGDSMTNDDMNVNTSADTSDKLFKPVKGSYVPFSEGYRACLGRRFAQVEVLAVLAVLFQNYSIELAVDKYANDAELDKMDENERAEIWQKAAEDARELMLNGMGVIITLQIRAGTVPFRLVPRGQEKFPVDVDEIWKKNHPDKISPSGNPDWSCWRSQKNQRTSNETKAEL